MAYTRIEKPNRNFTICLTYYYYYYFKKRPRINLVFFSQGIAYADKHSRFRRWQSQKFMLDGAELKHEFLTLPLKAIA
jgi:hypothetical protein